MPASRNVVDADGYVIRVYDLYHRTDPESAQAILASGRFVSHCQNPNEAYFTNMADGPNARQYGEAVVHVQVPTAAAIPDETFNDGEIFYRVPLTELGQNSVLGATGPNEPETRRPGSGTEVHACSVTPPRSRLEPSRGALEERRLPGGPSAQTRGLTP